MAITTCALIRTTSISEHYTFNAINSSSASDSVPILNLLTEGPVIRTGQLLHLDCSCLGLDNLTVSESSCFVWVARQLDTKRSSPTNVAQYWWRTMYSVRREHDSPTARWSKWLKREFTDRKVRGSDPTSASRLPLSRLGQLDSIPALVQPSGGMAARHRYLLKPLYLAL
ncbi:hypothetical protein T265_04228 [Opisthorchis viverrini]|uniref:Uncharacterized protein n=1 Tax=Opisthorchis viverrini TaxID=6198 RepID=A0A075AGT3_OPIVI|nr:hypothetical protein T265_04228 [Opisthorchis viverrini]KER29039.1 hypothetical protein T265_04228 [Opisthorchis viverrini]